MDMGPTDGNRRSHTASGYRGRPLRIGMMAKHSLEAEASSPFFLSIRLNVESQCRSLGILLRRVFRPGDPVAHQDLSELDGLIVIGAIDPAPILELLDGNRNVVFVKDSVRREPDIDIVQSNMGGAVAECLSILRNLGHRSIGFMGGAVAGLDIVTQRHASSLDVRHQAYMTWMREAGLLDPDRIHLGPWGVEGGYRMGVEALRKGLFPTAFLMANDAIASGALRAFGESGIRVPEDLSVISFDNTEIASGSEPPLSSVDLDTDEIGRQAVNLLLERIRGRVTPVHLTIPSRLVVRKSFSIPRDRGHRLRRNG